MSEIKLDDNGVCIICGVDTSEYGQGLNHKCKDHFITKNVKAWLQSKASGPIIDAEKTIGEKAEQIAECVATSENIEKDFDRILEFNPPDPIMNKLNQGFKDGMKKVKEEVYDGGPAFPRTGYKDPKFGINYDPQMGMTLRDWFAGMALSGLLNHHSHDFESGCRQSNEMANCAFLHSDAMLRAREK